MEYNDNYSKTSGSLWQNYRDEANATLTDFKTFKFKVKITGSTPHNGTTKNVKIAVSLKYISKFWRTLEMSLINCESYHVLNWSTDCVISSADGKTKYTIMDTKLYQLKIMQNY